MNTLVTAKEVINGGLLNMSPLNSRFDGSLLTPHIRESEMRFVKPIICDDLYNQMVSVGIECNYNYSCGPLQNKFPNNELWETVWVSDLYALCSYAVVYQSLPFIGLQIGSNGVFQNSSHYADNQGINGIKYLQDQLMDTILNIQERVKKYLVNNIDNFPQCGCIELECGCIASCCKCGSNTDGIGYDWGVITY